MTDDSSRTGRLVDGAGVQPVVQLRPDTGPVTAEPLAALESRNHELTRALTEARELIVSLRSDVEDMTKPPHGFAYFLGLAEEGEIDIVQAGRKLRVRATKTSGVAQAQIGQEIILNESMVAISVGSYERIGEIVSVKELLGADRVLLACRSDDERVAWLAAPLREATLRAGDTVIFDGRSGFAIEQIWRSDVETLLLEEAPDVDYEDIGGLGSQIEQIRDAVELPFAHPDLYRDHGLRPPKGVLLYGPPGCGKTLIAKAVAKSLATSALARNEAPAAGESLREQSEPRSFFLNIKGPELLNKYVGETERQIRLVFARAREKATAGIPVVVFFDEMDSLFRTRGTGVSSDVETTIVPQLLAEIDGVESLDNVIVIGASNREDMIDPAILRPGRLDVKIKIDRPDEEAARDIFGQYLTHDLPLHVDDLVLHGGDREATIATMIAQVVERMYAKEWFNEFLEVTYANGDRETLYFKDFSSGAMIRNIVDRAKKTAIKDLLSTGSRGLRVEHLLQACAQEFAENEDLPNTSNPDDWARVSGKKGERIVHIRTMTRGQEKPEISSPGEDILTSDRYL